MPLTAYGKNAALTGATKEMDWVNLCTASVHKPEASAAGTKIKLTGGETAGFTTGAVVAIAKLSGGAGLVEKRIYWVVGATANEFELAVEEAGAAVSFTTELLATTELAILKEISGGTNKRVKTTWGTAAAGDIEATAAIKIAVPASTTVAYAGWWSLETAGKLEAAEKLEHEETFAGAGEYELTSDKLEANALA